MKKLIVLFSAILLSLLYYTFTLTESLSNSESQENSKQATIDDLSKWLAESRLQTIQAEIEIKKNKLITEAECSIRLLEVAKKAEPPQNDESVTDPQVVWTSAYGTRETSGTSVSDRYEKEQANE